jgi:hypothetical protein
MPRRKALRRGADLPAPAGAGRHRSHGARPVRDG